MKDGYENGCGQLQCKRIDNQRVTVLAPTNIALIKYWGKRDEKLILPLNDSLSVTIDSLTAKTTVSIEEGKQGQTEDGVVINGKAINLKKCTRFDRVFEEARRLAKRHEDNRGERNIVFKVESETNFPIAAGLASSAAGFAALAFALSQLLSLTQQQASRLARIGSGSACRSLCGGLAHWKAGELPDGSDSLTESRFPPTHWSSLCCLILIFNEQEKETSSTDGMRRTAETSSLLKQRIENDVPLRVERLIKAFERRDFSELGEIIMQDSNQFHAVCMDTFPPLRYLTDESWAVINAVHAFNKQANAVKVAYSFDAGPNACVFMERPTLDEFLAFLPHFLQFPAFLDITASNPLSAALSSLPPPSSPPASHLPTLRNMIFSSVGSQPRVL